MMKQHQHKWCLDGLVGWHCRTCRLPYRGTKIYEEIVVQKHPEAFGRLKDVYLRYHKSKAPIEVLDALQGVLEAVGQIKQKEEL